VVVVIRPAAPLVVTELVVTQLAVAARELVVVVTVLMRSRKKRILQLTSYFIFISSGLSNLKNWFIVNCILSVREILLIVQKLLNIISSGYLIL
jgi:hypothetical protein